MNLLMVAFAPEFVRVFDTEEAENTEGISHRDTERISVSP